MVAKKQKVKKTSSGKTVKQRESDSHEEKSHNKQAGSGTEEDSEKTDEWQAMELHYRVLKSKVYTLE